MSKKLRILSLRGVRAVDSVASYIDEYWTELRRPSRFSPDVIVFPEGATHPGQMIPFVEMAELETGPTMKFFSDVAREKKAYVVGWCYLHKKPDERAKGSVYSVSSLFGRDGILLGIYRKAFPTEAEYNGLTYRKYVPRESGDADGVIPGPLGQEPISTDFGSWGMALCHDVNFRELWEFYGKRRVRIVFYQSAFSGGGPVNAHALLNGYYVVTAIWKKRDTNRVIDPWGKEVAVSEAGKALEAVIDLDEIDVSLEGVGTKCDDVKRDLGDTTHLEFDESIARCRIHRGAPSADSADLQSLLARRDLLSYMDFLDSQRLQIAKRRSRLPDVRRRTD